MKTWHRSEPPRGKGRGWGGGGEWRKNAAHLTRGSCSGALARVNDTKFPRAPLSGAAPGGHRRDLGREGLKVQARVVQNCACSKRITCGHILCMLCSWTRSPLECSAHACMRHVHTPFVDFVETEHAVLVARRTCVPTCLLLVPKRLPMPAGVRRCGVLLNTWGTAKLTGGSRGTEPQQAWLVDGVAGDLVGDVACRSSLTGVARGRNKAGSLSKPTSTALDCGGGVPNCTRFALCELDGVLGACGAWALPSGARTRDPELGAGVGVTDASTVPPQGRILCGLLRFALKLGMVDSP